MMKVLIAGTGSIGSEIAYAFHNKSDIICIDHGKNFEILRKELPKIRYVKGDIHDKKLIQIESKDADIIFYCIDTGSVVSSLNSSEKYKKTNIDNFNKFLKSIADLNSSHFFLFSSSYVYPDTKKITEKTKPHPETLYGKLRLMQEEILKDFTSNYTILRLSNIFGYGHFFNIGNAGAIEKFIDCIFTGQKIMLHGDGSQTVDYLYKTDLINLLKILIKNKPGKIYNVSTGISNSIYHMAKLVNRIAFQEYGKSTEIVKITVNKKLPNSPKISPIKIIKETSCSPSLNIEMHVKRMIKQYKQNMD